MNNELRINVCDECISFWENVQLRRRRHYDETGYCDWMCDVCSEPCGDYKTVVTVDLSDCIFLFDEVEYYAGKLKSMTEKKNK